MLSSLGPVDLALAIGLRLHGLLFCLVDRAPGPKHEPRAAVVWPRGAEVLDDLSLGTARRNAANPLQAMHFYRKGRLFGAARLGGVPSVDTAAAREALLGITPHLMDGMRSASEPYAQLLARTVRQRLGTTWGLAETGAAGSSGNRYGDAAGHTCCAVSGPQDLVRTLETGSPDRAANIEAFAATVLTLVLEAITAADPT